MVRVWQTAGLTVLAFAAGGSAVAQTINTTTASFTGYGRTAGQENRAVEFSSRDANSNLTVINGIITSDASSSASASGGGSASASSTGQGSANAIGNQLVVITQGNNNTVIVSSTQNNSGAITAITNVRSATANGN